jgi:hypothetical protein
VMVGIRGQGGFGVEHREQPHAPALDMRQRSRGLTIAADVPAQEIIERATPR